MLEQVIELIQNWIAEHLAPCRTWCSPCRACTPMPSARPSAPDAAAPAAGVVVAEGENDREGDDEDWRNVELPEGVTLR